MMSKNAAHIRNTKNIEEDIAITKQRYLDYWDMVKLSDISELPAAILNRDLLIAQYVYLNAMLDYVKQGGGSRGSYLIVGSEDENSNSAVDMSDMIQEICLRGGRDGSDIEIKWRKLRPIPDAPRWFENVWNEYNES